MLQALKESKMVFPTYFLINFSFPVSSGELPWPRPLSPLLHRPWPISTLLLAVTGWAFTPLFSTVTAVAVLSISVLFFHHHFKVVVPSFAIVNVVFSSPSIFTSSLGLLVIKNFQPSLSFPPEQCLIQIDYKLQKWYSCIWYWTFWEGFMILKKLIWKFW